MNTVPTKPKSVKLSATEKKLVQQIQAQTPAKSRLVKFVSNSVFGFAY